MFEIIKRFGRNTAGRDFVLGDLHGSIELVGHLLALVDFDPKVDRLFLVGDLGDRGRHSAACVALLREPWVHAVRGNHEQIFLDLFANGEADPDELAWQADRNGLGWVLELSPAERQAIWAEFAKLPLVIEVETERGTVGILHAEVPIGMDWPEFLAKVEARDPATIKSALWGRIRAETGNTSGVRGIDRIFVGHTPHKAGVQRYGNIYYVDTAAVFADLDVGAGRLTMANLMCQSKILTMPRAAPHLIDLRDEPTDSPFGQYARR